MREGDRDVRAELARVREEEERLRRRLREIEALHRSACDELVSLQEQVVHAAGLHAALRRLYESTDRAGILEAIQDIVVNVVGSEQLAVLEARPGGGLDVVASLGATVTRAQLGDGSLAAALARGEILVGEGAAGVGPGILACVPLRARDELAGGLLLFGLLPQKARLCPGDLEVLELLQFHGGLALRSVAPGGDAHAGR